MCSALDDLKLVVLHTYTEQFPDRNVCYSLCTLYNHTNDQRNNVCFKTGYDQFSF